MTVFWPSPPRASPPMAGPHPTSPLSQRSAPRPPAPNSSIGGGWGLRVGPICRVPSPQWTASPSRTRRTRCSITEVGAVCLGASYCDLAPLGSPGISGRWGPGWAFLDPSGQAEGGCSRDGGPALPVDHSVPPWTCPSSGSHNPPSPFLTWLRWAPPPWGFRHRRVEDSQAPGQAARRRADGHRRTRETHLEWGLGTLP